MALDQQRINELQESTGHSVFSPSSMKRIILCPGSVIAELNSPIPPSSPYAEEGTLLHSYCEEAMQNAPKNPILYVNQQNWTDERKVLVIDALEYVLGIIEKHIGPVTIKLEARGTLAEWGMPEIYGTMDVQVISATRVDVLDYKFGFGIQVFAKDNPQCVCYLGGSVPFNDGSRPRAELFVHIVQPTLNHYDEWHVSWEDLCSHILTDIKRGIDEAKTSEPGYHPSMEACRWCNAKIKCQHRRKNIRQQAHAIAKAAKNPADLPKEQWKIILDAADDLQQAIKDVRLYAQAEIHAGRGFPGYKLVAGRSQRRFSDKKKGEAYLIGKLGDKAYKKPETVTLAQAEKLQPGLKKDPKWKSLITKPTGKPVLKKESDPGKALEFKMENEFKDAAKQYENVEETPAAAVANTSVVIENL